MVVNQIVDQKNVRQLIRTFVNISKNLQKIVRNVTIFFMYLFLYQYQYFIEIDDICEHFQKLMKIVGKFVENCRKFVGIMSKLQIFVQIK